jgi:hypothetical protein
VIAHEADRLDRADVTVLDQAADICDSILAAQEQP